MKLRRRSRIPASAGARVESLLADAADARRAFRPDHPWQFLEDAHVLSQPWVRPHVRVHVAMLSLGWSQRDRSEDLWPSTSCSSIGGRPSRHGTQVAANDHIAQPMYSDHPTLARRRRQDGSNT